MADRYYEVEVVKSGGSPQAAFTYSNDQLLKSGQLVSVSLGPRQSLGVVTKAVPRPSFATKAVTAVLEVPPLPSELCRLADWVADYYVTPKGRVWQTVLPGSLTPRTAKIPTATMPQVASARATLSPAQAGVVQQIAGSSPSQWLLYGATGSGKTHIYLELAHQALIAGKSSLILVPEIGLTPQINQQLSTSLEGRVLITHSGLTLSQRREIWLQAIGIDQPWVVVGPRSALFTPLKTIRYIMIDEAHDSSYKQDQAPRYQAVALANQLAKLHHAKVILGTATPSISAYYAAQRGQLAIARLPKSYYRAQRQPSQLIDLKDKSQLRRSRLLSEPLIEALATTLASSKQSILFLNRRGSARLLLCRRCGWRGDCPNCQLPLTWHSDQGQLRCHACGYQQPPPAACPNCNNLEIKFIGSGTKKLEAEVARLFPNAKLGRLDRDSFDPKTINQLYQQLREGKIDILLGTQMITKGLDLPGVELVGVVTADNMLYLPDFSANERTFQLLYQVSGRAGRRSGSRGQTIIQTYSPDHPAIQAAAARDYQAFYDTELAQRQSLGYPPFRWLLKLWITKPSRSKAIDSAQALADQLRQQGADSDLQILGPAPAWREVMGAKYTWQIIVKAKQHEYLVKIAQNLPAGWTHDLDPIDLL